VDEKLIENNGTRLPQKVIILTVLQCSAISQARL